MRTMRIAAIALLCLALAAPVWAVGEARDGGSWWGSVREFLGSLVPWTINGQSSTAGAELDPDGASYRLPDVGPAMDPGGVAYGEGDVGPAFEPNGMAYGEGDMGPAMDPNGVAYGEGDVGPAFEPGGNS